MSTPNNLVACDRDTVEPDETPCATYTSRIIDTVAHLQDVMTVEMEI